MTIVDIDYSNLFMEALQYLQSNYKKFPKFMIEITAEQYGIPSAEIKNLINFFLRKGMLKIIKNEGFYYQLNL